MSDQLSSRFAEEVFVFPASFAQQRLWFIEQLMPDAALYTIPLVFRLTGSLNRSALEQSLQAIVERHESLRTRFEVVAGELVQVIAPITVSIPLIPLQTGTTSDREAVALEQIRQETQQPFNLSQDALFRVRLWQFDPSEHLLLILLHHIIFDEWSSGVLIRELGAFYAAFAQQQPAKLPALPIQYADFASWQRRWLQGDVLNTQLNYWRQQLKDVAVLNLSDGPRAPKASQLQQRRGASQLLELPQSLLDALEDLSQQTGVTLFMMLLAAFQTLLHRYTEQTDIVVGSPIANRHRSELEGLIGFLVNSLVLRTDFAGDPAFRELLDRVRSTTLAAYAHQDLPFEKLVEELQPTRSLSQNPLFQVVFALQNTPIDQLDLPELTLSPVEFETETTRFDLEVYVWKCAGNFRNLWGKGWQQSDGLRGIVVYNTELFDASAIAALRQHFQTLLERIVADPDARLSTLSLLTPQEQQQQWNNNQSHTSYPNLAIHRVFEAQAQQQPNAIAVRFANQAFTYEALNRGSNQLARYLQKQGIEAEMRVGICLKRTTDAIAAMLAVLKAGGVYVPIDPRDPLERVQFVLNDAEITVLLTHEHWTSFESVKVIGLKQDWSAIAQESEEDLSQACTLDQLAYVMYTSGSTGTPKGVMVTHRAVNRLVCQTNYIQIEPSDTVAQAANLAFDAATFEVWGALLNGAQLVGIERETTLISTEFAIELQRQQISVMFLTTALFNQTVNQVPDAFKPLKYLLFGGETALLDPVRSALKHGKPQHLIHVYGPTENTTFSTWYEIHDLPETATTIPIGQAIANTQIHVLDAAQNPVPPTVSGELYLGGDGLARGYLNRPDLTAKVFLQVGRDRLYKTGDRARYRMDGMLEFLGRTDAQIKLRGFRIELGEVEAALTQHPAVRSAVVTVREIEADRQLVAYIVATETFDVRSFLKTKLPAYMVPAVFVEVDTIPLTTNGKVDYRALPTPKQSLEPDAIAPTTSVEKSLVELWSHLLGRDVGIHDNFFELGGHSLLATQLVSRIRDQIGVELPLRSVFETPTIAELAQQLGTPDQLVCLPQVLQSTAPDRAPLSFAQQRLWFLDRLAANNPFYNVPAAIRFKGTLNQAALARSFNYIVERHAALRTTFTTVDNQPVQIIAPELKITVPIVQLETITSVDRDLIVQQFATTEAQRCFDLERDPLLRVTLLQFDATESVLLLTLHHIVADGWSLGVLIQELACCYTAFAQRSSPDLPDLPIQYADFACWQRNWLQGEVLAQQLGYWQKQLQDLSMLELPIDRPRPAVQTYQGATYPLQLSPTLTAALNTLSQQQGATLFMTLLAAFQTLLYRYTGQTDIAIGSPIANRHRTELEGLIGFFVNSLVLRSDLSGNPTFTELLRRVRDVALEAYRHQDIPFEKLVEELDPERDLSRNPLFQVAFALQNAPMQSLELPRVTLEPIALEPGTTRFDLEVHLWEPTHGLRSLWQSQEGLSGFVAYSTDLFDRDTIARFVAHFQTLLQGIVSNPDARLSALPILVPAERQQQIEWNQTDTQFERSFAEIFTREAQRLPNAIAIVSDEASISYAELNNRADRLAQLLRQKGVQADCLVGLCVDRSIDLVVGILGILKAGGAFVPLDPQYPSDRLQFMLNDTEVSILLTQSWLVETLPTTQAEIICLDRPLPENSDQAPSRVTPDQLAYVIYTSGSTGTPKGVLITQRGLCNVVKAQRQVFDATSKSRILQFSSISFDASVFEIALAIGCGGTLYIPPKSAQLPGTELIQFLQNHAITHALITPSVLNVLPSTDLPALQTLITGGEACSRSVLDRWATNRRFFNAYGPTETTIWATVAELYSGDDPSTIGRPVANTQIQLLDAALNPVPIGVVGELYIGGAGVARGYLNRPQLTAERFIDSDTKLYKTGDQARYRSDGRIQFLGRVDTQIKIRGFRVELGEIDATLQRHPAIESAVTVAAKNEEMRLIAYFKLDRAQIQTEALQAQQIQQWQTLYNQTYQLNSDDFNITGWQSSYTGEPIPAEQMREWVHDRVDQILALNPQRILEIGCGTGLLLFQLAPHCQSYCGTDFSTVALAALQHQIDDRNLSQIKLLHRTAIDFEGIDTDAFDVVILNSVVQYFPSLDYFIEVIEKAVETVAPGGVIWLGDLRSFPLLTTFHTWVQFSRADSALDRVQLRQRVERSRFEEPELTIDPTFFEALRDRIPRIRHVQIRLIRGRSQNEMTQFRYDVLLHLDGNNAPYREIEWIDWRENPVRPIDIQQQIRETEPELLGIANIANQRISDAVKTTDWLLHQTHPKTVGRMREVLQAVDCASTYPCSEAIDPQDWWDLETVLPYRVEICWSACSHTGAYDVVLVRHGVTASIVPLSQPADRHYSNEPLQSQFARQLIPELRNFLKQSLPDYMVPAVFVPLEDFPLTANGKLDRALLPLPANEPTRSEAALTQTETVLAEIWQDLLRLKQVNGHDNFFELGGHSLLATQLTSRVRDAFGLELPLQTVFESPTIAQLAPTIETLRQAVSDQTVPALVRLDRAAHRRVRSALATPLQPARVWSPLVPLTIRANTRPFFCVHPIFGVVFPYLELAHQLNRSFYGLQPLGLGEDTPFVKIEPMAAYYIEAMRSIQPRGPYLLGGWSFGGLVAFEMAQQLLQANQDVELLAILDTPAPGSQPSLGQSLNRLRTALGSMLPYLLDFGAIRHKRSQWKTWFSEWQWSAIADLMPEETQLRLLDESAIGPLLRIFQANSQAAQRYVPQPYSNQITLFRAAEQPHHSKLNSTLGWSNLAQDVQLYQTGGNHLSMLKQPHVQTLAQQIQRCLDRSNHRE